MHKGGPLKSYSFTYQRYDGTVAESKTPTKMQTFLLGVLKNPTESDEKKKLAADILDWFDEYMTQKTIPTPLDGAAYLLSADSYADELWSGISRLEKRTTHGVESKVVVLNDRSAIVNSEVEPEVHEVHSTEESPDDGLSEGEQKLREAKALTRGLL